MKTGRRKGLSRVLQPDLFTLSQIFELPTDMKAAVLRENLNNLSSEVIMQKMFDINNSIVESSIHNSNNEENI